MRNMVILDRIVAAKRHEVASLKEATPLARLKEAIADLPAVRDFQGDRQRLGLCRHRRGEEELAIQGEDQGGV